MDLEAILRLASTYLAQYLRDFIATLQAPWPRATQPHGTILAADGRAVSVAATHPDALEVLNAHVWVFVFLSIFIGSTLTAMANRTQGADLQVIVVYVAVSWLAFSAYAFVLGRYVLRGKADFLSSVRATLFCLGVTYVIASFVSLLGSFAPPTVVKFTTYHWVPKAAYLATQGVLLATLLGRNFRALNALRGWRAAIFVILAPVPILLINLLAGVAVWSEPWMPDLIQK